jgi:hypothetical protein
LEPKWRRKQTKQLGNTILRKVMAENFNLRFFLVINCMEFENVDQVNFSRFKEALAPQPKPHPAETLLSITFSLMFQLAVASSNIGKIMAGTAQCNDDLQIVDLSFWVTVHSR